MRKNETCISHSNGYECNFKRMWTGQKCNERNVCDLDNPCNSHGNCSMFEPNFSCSCTCISGCVGSFRSFPDFCYSSPCGKHGACKNMLESYHCICDTQWLGHNCQVNACENITCNHRGICLADLSTSMYHCGCTGGWIGHNKNRVSFSIEMKTMS